MIFPALVRRAEAVTILLCDIAVFEAPELLHLALVGPNQVAPEGEALGLVEPPVLLLIADGDFPRTARLGPGVLQNKPVAAIRPLGLDLDRFLAPQSEPCLQRSDIPRVALLFCNSYP